MSLPTAGGWLSDILWSLSSIYTTFIPGGTFEILRTCSWRVGCTFPEPNKTFCFNKYYIFAQNDGALNCCGVAWLIWFELWYSLTVTLKSCHLWYKRNLNESYINTCITRKLSSATRACNDSGKNKSARPALVKPPPTPPSASRTTVKQVDKVQSVISVKLSQLFFYHVVALMLCV